MAPQPKRKHSRKRARIRLQAKKLHSANLIPCPDCRRLIRSHRICPYCGYYNRKAFIVRKKRVKQA